MIMASAHVIVSYALSRGTERLPKQLLRFALTLWLAFMVWRGQRWARVLTIALLGIGAVITLTSSKAFLVLGAPYLAAMSLLLTPHAGAFLAEQRRER